MELHELNERLRSPTFETTVIDPRTHEEIDVVVEYTQRQAYAGRRERSGAQTEPDEHGGIEVEAVYDKKGRDIFHLLDEQALEKLSDDISSSLSGEDDHEDIESRYFYDDDTYNEPVEP